MHNEQKQPQIIGSDIRPPLLSRTDGDERCAQQLVDIFSRLDLL